MLASSMLPVLIILVAAIVGCAALPAIQVKGSFLFDSSSGNRFYVKGVAYSGNYGSSETNSIESSGQVSAEDPLANSAGCTRDIPFFNQLGINLIRVYQVNATLDHSGCMKALDAAGIYVLLDLATPSLAINTNSPSWNVELLTSFITTVDAFASFPNVFGFNVGNEVINTLADDDAAPFIKGAVRDIKSYLSSRNFTQLVGYTATDSPNSRVSLAMYLACDDIASTIDYWGINIYEWCGQSTFEQSGYQARTEELQGLGVPAFFSEYGCNTVEPRTFQDVATLYSTNMTGVWSGGIIFEYQNESNNFGLGTISPDGSSYTPNTDFSNLKSALAAVSPPSQAQASYTPTVSLPVACPPSNDTWPVSTNLPPTPNDAVCKCVTNDLSCIAATADPTVIGTTLGTVCGLTSCSIIEGNGTTGVYGALSFCDPLQSLNIVLDQYWESQNRNPSACSFNGAATISAPSGAPTAPSAVASATSSCIAAGFVSGTGIPSPTSIPPGATTRPIVSGTSASSTTKKSGGIKTLSDLRDGGIVFLVLVALMGCGASMVLSF